MARDNITWIGKETEISSYFTSASTSMDKKTATVPVFCTWARRKVFLFFFTTKGSLVGLIVNKYEEIDRQKKKTWNAVLHKQAFQR